MAKDDGETCCCCLLGIGAYLVYNAGDSKSTTQHTTPTVNETAKVETVFVDRTRSDTTLAPEGTIDDILKKPTQKKPEVKQPLTVDTTGYGVPSHPHVAPKNKPAEKHEETPVVDTTGYKKPGFLLSGVIHYQKEIGPDLKARLGRDTICRYEPSCSEYARQAMLEHGELKGAAMGAARIARCNPFSKGGYDPVPRKEA